jgi:hypothetical protein
LTRWAAVAVAAAVVAASGCGGGERLSKPEFRTRANAICTKYYAKIKRTLANLSGDAQSRATAIRKAVAYSRKGTEELDALEPPQVFDAKYKEFSRLNHEGNREADKLADAVRANDEDTWAATLTKLDALGRRADRLASRMGLRACVSD